MPRALVGGTTSIRLNSTADEREAKPHQRRTRALRPISEADPDFDRLIGLRQDSESNNSQYKQTLHLNRARSVGTNRLRLDLIAYQCVSIITTLVAHNRRTGSSLKGWFGDCPPPTSTPMAPRRWGVASTRLGFQTQTTLSTGLVHKRVDRHLRPAVDERTTDNMMNERDA